MVAEVCALNLPGATPERVAMAVRRRNKRADIRVAYELLLDSKKAKHRKEGPCSCVCVRVHGVSWCMCHGVCVVVCVRVCHVVCHGVCHGVCNGVCHCVFFNEKRGVFLNEKHGVFFFLFHLRSGVGIAARLTTELIVYPGINRISSMMVT